MSIQEKLQDRIYGIDLGTTNSCLAYVDEASGVPVVVANAEGQLITPSVVYFAKAGDGVDSEVLVGQSAKNSLPVDPERGVAFIKREMGTGTITTIDGKPYSPTMISAIILRKLVQDASERLTEQTKLLFPIRRAVVTVPAYFGQVERASTIAACTEAGLTVVDLLNEPTAAALSFRAGQPPVDDVILVFDLGGGTFDVTVMQVAGTSIAEIAIEGDSRRGGYDWDLALLNLVIDKFLEQHPELSTEAKANKQWSRSLLDQIEGIKKSLSKSETRTETITYGKVAAEVTISRRSFEAETKVLLDGTIARVKTVISTIKDQNLLPRRVYLVGGSTRMPAVSKALEELLSKLLPHKVEVILRDPDLAVAKGAAFHGFITRLKEVVKENNGDFSSISALYPLTEPYIKASPVSTVLSRALGYKILRNKKYEIDHLVFHNDQLPISRETTYATITNNQNVVTLGVYEQAGEVLSSDPEHNKRIGEIVLSNLRSFGLPEGSPLTATLRVESNGTVNVSATEAVSGKSVSATLTIDGAPSAEEITAVTTELTGLRINRD